MITLSLALPSQVYSTVQSYGTFRGVIVDLKGKRIRGAVVSVSGPDFKREIKPTSDGYFELTLPIGKYEITVKKSGYATYTLTNLEVGRNQELSHVFRLESSQAQSAALYTLGHSAEGQAVMRFKHFSGTGVIVV
jgi:hypothetical protein